MSLILQILQITKFSHYTVHVLYSTVHVLCSTVYVLYSTVNVLYSTVHILYSTVYVLYSTVHVLYSTVHVLYSTVHVIYSTVHVLYCIYNLLDVCLDLLSSFNLPISVVTATVNTLTMICSVLSQDNYQVMDNISCNNRRYVAMDSILWTRLVLCVSTMYYSVDSNRLYCVIYL